MEENDIEKVLDELNHVRPEILNPEAKRLFDAIMKIADERDMYKTKYQNELDEGLKMSEFMVEQRKRIEELERQTKIKDAYNKLLVDIGFDYDGCEEAESLKSVIDDLVDLAKKAIENNDTYGIYGLVGGKTLNILFEEVNNERSEQN